MKGKTAIAKILKQEGVEFVTGFPYNPLFDAIAGEGIRPIKTRTERVAVNIAPMSKVARRSAQSSPRVWKIF